MMMTQEPFASLYDLLSETKRQVQKMQDIAKVEQRKIAELQQENEKLKSERDATRNRYLGEQEVEARAKFARLLTVLGLPYLFYSTWEDAFEEIRRLQSECEATRSKLEEIRKVCGVHYDHEIGGQHDTE